MSEISIDCIRATWHRTNLIGPNLAKADFLAKQSRSKAKIGKESARHAHLNAQNGALDGRKVRTMGRLRSFECAEGANPSKRAVKGLILEKLS
jgi:hypothetical protein